MALQNQLRRLWFYFSPLGRRVEQLWSEESEPLLVCSMRVKHSTSRDREKIDLMISKSHVTIRHVTSHPDANHKPSITIPSSDLANDLIESFNDLGLLVIGSVSESIWDGSVSFIAAKDTNRVNIFREYSMRTPQAKIRDALLELAHAYLTNVEQISEDQLPVR